MDPRNLMTGHYQQGKAPTQNTLLQQVALFLGRPTMASSPQSFILLSVLCRHTQLEATLLVLMLLQPLSSSMATKLRLARKHHTHSSSRYETPGMYTCVLFTVGIALLHDSTDASKNMNCLVLFIAISGTLPM